MSRMIHLMHCVAAFGALAVLAGCGGGGGGGEASINPGTEIVTPGLESYTTQHNGYSRVRLTRSAGESDDTALVQFDDADPASPAGYKSLIAETEAAYARTMTIEVIAEVNGDGDPTRILRLTADQTPVQNIASASGKYYFRGKNYVWVSVDGAALQSGYDQNGLVDMVIDFDAQTASINLRTGVDAGSDVRTEIVATGMPFNVSSGAYGGAITLSVWVTGGDILTADGMLRGNIGGDMSDVSRENLTTSGAYTAESDRIAATGIFYGQHPNKISND
ncbi:hypothetical protein [Frigidibacter mobilis]|uniref:Viral aspartic protease n=1 Tax=Frigidibacter mobilis TaxID=1335048 RepID=A0A159Z3A5_9RHOB|nr:hypothetical protein [Frigidibacter mobilis]AMY68630.1 viral aspartic protease [Frigidibacter mobilis]